MGASQDQWTMLWSRAERDLCIEGQGQGAKHMDIWNKNRTKEIFFQRTVLFSKSSVIDYTYNNIIEYKYNTNHQLIQI